MVVWDTRIFLSNGGLYTMGAFGNTEKLLAFNASTGKKVWELPIGDLLTNGWEMDRVQPLGFRWKSIRTWRKRKSCLCGFEDRSKDLGNSFGKRLRR